MKIGLRINRNHVQRHFALSIRGQHSTCSSICDVGVRVLDSDHCGALANALCVEIIYLSFIYLWLYDQFSGTFYNYDFFYILI